MYVIFLVILALLAFSALDHNFSVAVALGGLVWLVWSLNTKLDLVTRKLKDLESKLSEKEGAASTDTTTETSTQSTFSEDDLLEEMSRASQSDSTDKAFTDATDGQVDSSIMQQSSMLLKSEDAAASITDSQTQEQDLTVDQPTAAQAIETAAEPIEPAKPRDPNIFEKLIAAAWNWVTDGNVFVRVGIIVLFMGMTFLTRYAIGQNLIPIEVRLAAISAVAIALLFWGWRQRETRQAFSLVVQGGGVGLLYLTIFAGFSLYDVIPSTIAFALLALLVVLAAILAITQDAKPLALFATIGGFLAPVLTSSGNNNYIGLFSYYSLLNLGVFAVAWFKSWRILNFVGFIFTFVVSTAWGVLSYQQEFFYSTEPFLIFFFLLYVAIGILFAHKRTPFYKDYVDSSLIFGTPVFVFGLQCAMVKDYQYGVAISAAVLGVFYLCLTSVLWKKFGDRLRLLSETYLSIGVIFTTLAIPFAIDGYLSGAAWAIEGAGILWVSIRQQQKYRRYFGVALIFAAGAMLLYGLQTAETSRVFINSFFIGCVITSIAATIGACLLSKDFDGKTKLESSIASGLLVYAVTVLLGGFEIEINSFGLHSVHGPLLAVLSTIVIITYTFLATKLKWSQAHWVSLAFVLPLSAAAISCFSYQAQFSQNFGFLIWPLALIATFYSFKQALSSVDKRALLVAHILAASICVGLLLWNGIWQLMLGYSLLAIVFNQLGKKYEWQQLKLLALGFFPVLVVCSLLAIKVDGNLVTLSNFSGTFRLPFPPGFALWPFGFAVYFYLVYQNKQIAGANNKYLHYVGGALIGALLFWLGLGPLMLGASLLAILFCLLWQKYDWPEMRVISMALFPAMLLTASNSLRWFEYYACY